MKYCIYTPNPFFSFFIFFCNPPSLQALNVAIGRKWQYYDICKKRGRERVRGVKGPLSISRFYCTSRAQDCCSQQEIGFNILCESVLTGPGYSVVFAQSVFPRHLSTLRSLAQIGCNQEGNEPICVHSTRSIIWQSDAQRMVFTCPAV